VGSRADGGDVQLSTWGLPHISILPTLSKIFEKIMLDQLVTYFSANNLFHDAQYGFTKGRSTTDAGVALLKRMLGAWEKSQNALGVFCDLSKAF
jgi:hypothetical protein